MAPPCIRSSDEDFSNILWYKQGAMQPLGHMVCFMKFSPRQQLLSGLQTIEKDNRLKLQSTVKTAIPCEKQNIATRNHRQDATHLDNDENHGEVVMETDLVTYRNNALLASKITQNETIEITGSRRSRPKCEKCFVSSTLLRHVVHKKNG